MHAIGNTHGGHVPFSLPKKRNGGKKPKNSAKKHTLSYSPCFSYNLITGCQRLLYNLGRYLSAVAKM